MDKKGNPFFRIVDSATDRIGGAISLVALPIVLIIAIEVVSRYVFGSPTVWVWPVTKQLFGIFALFGGAYALLYGRHIRVEVLYERFGPRMKLASAIITSVFFLFFIGILVWQGYLMAEASLRVGETLTGRFHMPLYPLKIIIPLAALLFLLQGISIFWREIRGKKPPREQAAEGK